MSGSSDGEVRVIDVRGAGGGNRGLHSSPASSSGNSSNVYKSFSLGVSAAQMTIHKRALAVAAWTSAASGHHQVILPCFKALR